MFKEFKEFIAKGNVMDLAVGVIIGGAFGKIVTSLVNDILMPLLSILTGGINFSDLKIVLKAGNESKKIAEVAFKYGAFIQNVIDFLIIAFCIFMMVKAMNKLTRKKEEVVEEAPTGPTQEEILTDIKNILNDIKEKTKLDEI